MKDFKSPIAFLFVVACLLISCNNEKKEAAVEEKIEMEKPIDLMNTLTEKEKEQGLQLLFNGKNMDKWRSFNGTGTSGWKVENGEMIALGEESNDLVTKRTFDNFELRLEWKVSEKGNSGIFFHVQEGEKYKYVYETGPEFQILDNFGAGSDTPIKYLAGANYDMHPPMNAKAKPAGEWNEARLLHVQNKVVHFLNGVKVVEYVIRSEEWEKLVQASKWKDYPDYGRFKKGHIALQDHGGVIAFRNIKIREF